MYDEAKDLVTHCKGCNKIMLIKDYKIRKPLNPYLVELGYKETGKFWCGYCVYVSQNGGKTTPKGELRV